MLLIGPEFLRPMAGASTAVAGGVVINGVTDGDAVVYGGDSSQTPSL